MSDPFLIFPWQHSFLGALKQRILHDTGGKPGNALIVVPNQRPWQYFRQLFEDDHRAFILPKMITSRAMSSIWKRHCAGPAMEASALDQIYYLYQCVGDLAQTQPLLNVLFGKMPIAQFLPWGVSLAQALEDIFSQGALARNIAVPEGDLHRYAIALLGCLAQISDLWRETLTRNHLTTPGFDVLQACEHLDDLPPELTPGPERPIYIAGFSVFSAGYEALFRALWRKGATMCFHADTALSSGAKFNDACKPIAELMERWHASATAVSVGSAAEPHYTFYAAYDGHSQLEQLGEDLRNQEGGTTAIVLPSAELLNPTLHHLDNKDVNISMGYPLARTPLIGLLHNIFQLLLNRLPDGRYYWRDLDLLLRNPLIGMLRQGNELFRQKAAPALTSILRGGERKIDLGKYVDLKELEEAARKVAPKLPLWCNNTLKLGIRFFEAMGKVRTPTHMAQLLGLFTAYIGRKALMLPKMESEPGERQYPLDTEALIRLWNNVFPALGQNAMADEEFSLTTLRDMLQLLVESERIPFTAYPLLGAQVLGMLETRLLQFDHVYVMDASDDLLPGGDAQDPLLPDALRAVIGLPQRKERRQTAAYNLARLCAGAKTVHFYWAQGDMPSSSEQGKKRRSRFVERLLWTQEKNEKKLLKPGHGNLRAAEPHMSIHRGYPRPIAMTPGLRNKLQAVLSGSVSSAMLASYMNCPAQFAYKYLLNLHAPAELNEGDDPLAIGNCVHDILRDLYKPLLKSDVPDDEKSRRLYLDEHLGAIFQNQVDQHHLETKLPVFSWLYFEKAAPRHIAAYFMDQTQHCQPLFLEKEAQEQINLGGKKYAFGGRIDRVDLRDGKLVIVDYKTGKPRTSNSSLWNDEEFLLSLDQCVTVEDFAQRGDNLLDVVRENIPDLQLPIYLLLASQDIKGDIGNAAYVWLREKKGKKESLLWPEEMDSAVGLERCVSLVSFVVRHLSNCGNFMPRGPMDLCDYCDYYDACFTSDSAGPTSDDEQNGSC